MLPPRSRDLPAPIRFRALGTTAVVAVADGSARDEAGSLLAAELDAIDRACSRFRDDSELARLNASPGRWRSVSSLFLGALEVALTAARTTNHKRGRVVGPSTSGARSRPGATST